MTKGSFPCAGIGTDPLPAFRDRPPLPHFDSIRLSFSFPSLFSRRPCRSFDSPAEETKQFPSGASFEGFPALCRRQQRPTSSRVVSDLLVVPCFNHWTCAPPSLNPLSPPWRHCASLSNFKKARSDAPLYLMNQGTRPASPCRELSEVPGAHLSKVDDSTSQSSRQLTWSLWGRTLSLMASLMTSLSDVPSGNVASEVSPGQCFAPLLAGSFRALASHLPRCSSPAVARGAGKKKIQGSASVPFSHPMPLSQVDPLSPRPSPLSVRDPDS